MIWTVQRETAAGRSNRCWTGGTVDGKEVKMNVATGQKVIYSKYAGTTVEIDDEEYIIVKQVTSLQSLNKEVKFEKRL